MSGKPASRATRWAECVGEARRALDEVESSASKLSDALGALKEIQGEFESWRDNLPENLQSSALGEKLSAVCDLDLEAEVDVSAVSDVIGEAEGLDLPLGFGRD